MFYGHVQVLPSWFGCTEVSRNGTKLRLAWPQGAISTSRKVGVNLILPSRHLLIRDAVTKQLNDKERVAAAMEVDAIMESINNCLSTAGRRGEK